MQKDEEFRKQYTRAKEESGDADQDKLDEIAERVLDGSLDPQAARVAADIIKWSASKKKPKKYGDRIALGGDPDNPISLLLGEIKGRTLGPK
jgi:DNA-binding ferritin-like protein